MNVNKKNTRIRRAGKTRQRIRVLKVDRLCVHRTNQHIYAQVITFDGSKVITSASSLKFDNNDELKDINNNIQIATLVGKIIAQKALALGVSKVAFDRSGYKYHGRIKALAESARENGLNF